MFAYLRILACLILCAVFSLSSEAASLVSECVRAEVFWQLGNAEPASNDILLYLPNKSAKTSELKTALFARDGKQVSREVAGKDLEVRFQCDEGNGASPVAALLDKFIHTPRGRDLLSGYHPSFHLGPSRANISVRDVSLQVNGNQTEVSAVIDLLEVQNASSRVDLISKGVGGLSLPAVSAKSVSPITVRVPVSVNMSPEGKVGFQFHELPHVNLSNLSVEMDGAKIPTEKVFEFLHETGVVSKVRTQLLDFLNTQVAQQLSREAKHTAQVAHPMTGAPLLKVEISPQSLTADSKGLTAGIRAKLNPGERVEARSIAKNFQCPIGGTNGCPEYDGAVAVNQSLIQNLIGHLYESGAMSGLKAGDRTVSLVEPPTIQYLSSKGAESFAKSDHAAAYVKVGLRVRPDHLSGLEGMVLNQNFSIRTEVSLKAAPSKDGKGIEVQVLGANVDKYAVNEAGLRGPARMLAKLASFAPSSVSDTVQNVVADAINSKLRNLASLPPIQLPLPKDASEHLGSVKIVGIQFDDQNNLYFLFK